jgi:hypothetical protein
MRRIAVVQALLALGGAPLASQVRVAGDVLMYLVREGTPAEAITQSGTWGGAEGRVTLGAYALTLRGLGGSLGGNPARFDRNVRLTTISLRRRLGSSVFVGVDAEAHRLASDVSIAVWRLFGVSAAGGMDLGVRGLRTRADLAYFPLSNAKGSSPVSSAVRAEIGLTYASPRFPLEAQLGYRWENVYFTQAADHRFGAIVVGVGVRLGQGGL